MNRSGGWQTSLGVSFKAGIICGNSALKCWCTLWLYNEIPLIKCQSTKLLGYWFGICVNFNLGEYSTWRNSGLEDGSQFNLSLIQ